MEEEFAELAIDLFDLAFVGETAGEFSEAAEAAAESSPLVGASYSNTAYLPVNGWGIADFVMGFALQAFAYLMMKSRKADCFAQLVNMAPPVIAYNGKYNKALAFSAASIVKDWSTELLKWWGFMKVIATCGAQYNFVS